MVEGMKVQASFSAPVDLKTRIMYIPEGEHGITPTVDGKPGSIVSKVAAERGEHIVEALNKSLSKRKAKNVRAIIDFDHKDEGPAAAIPSAFAYEQGKGIMMDVEWTGKGTSSIEGKDYSYFSPVYNMDRNTGEPIGLPSSGPIGALVNNPAFTEIERIAASNTHNQQNKPEMDHTALISAGLVTEAEAKTDKVAEIAASKFKSIQVEAAKVSGLEEKVVKLEASLAKSAEVSADQLIKAAVDSGRIAAKDESTENYWKGQLVESSHDPERFAAVSAALNAIPANDDLTKQIVTVAGGAVKPAGSEARIEAAQSQARTELGAGANFQAVWDKANELDPSAFAE